MFSIISSAKNNNSAPRYRKCWLYASVMRLNLLPRF